MVVGLCHLTFTSTSDEVQEPKYVFSMPSPSLLLSFILPSARCKRRIVSYIYNPSKPPSYTVVPLKIGKRVIIAKQSHRPRLSSQTRSANCKPHSNK